MGLSVQWRFALFVLQSGFCILSNAARITLALGPSKIHLTGCHKGLVLNNLQKELVFENNRKSKGIAYLLWLFLGWLGAHRFYAGETKTGAIQLVMTLSAIGVPFMLVWLLIDLFLIPGMVNDHNLELLRALNDEGYREGYPLDEGEEEKEDRSPLLSHNEPDPPLDSKRARMLEELRATGYRKKRRDFSSLYQ